MRNSVDMGLSPDLFKKSEKRAWCLLLCMCLTSQHSGNSEYYVLRSIVTPGSCIFNRTLAISVQDLDSAVLYAFIRHWGKTAMLKLKNKVFILAAYGFCQIKLFTVYIICVVTIVLREQHNSTEGIRPGKRLGKQCSSPSNII